MQWSEAGSRSGQGQGQGRDQGQGRGLGRGLGRRLAACGGKTQGQVSAAFSLQLSAISSETELGLYSRYALQSLRDCVADLSSRET